MIELRSKTGSFRGEMNFDNPKVSIITPLYNKAPYFSETADSVFAQTMGNFEWIVIDDFSSDESAELLRRIEDPRVIKHFHKGKRGPCATRNEGLELARGKWLLFLDSDDLITPEHLENLLAAATGREIVAGGWVEKMEDGQQNFSPASISEVEDYAIAFAPWAIHSAIISHEICPRWPERLDRTPAEDISFWFMAIRNRRLNYIDSFGAIYRKSVPQNRSSESDLTVWYRGVMAAIEENLRVIGGLDSLTPKQTEYLMRLHEGFWWRAHDSGNREVELTALRCAKKWLHRSRPANLPLLARKLFGIPLFHMLAHRFDSK